MTLNEKLTILDDLKAEIIALRGRIQDLETDIAIEICPISVGETITINDGNKEYQGIVEEVDTLYSPYDFIEPTIGNRPTWRAKGPRINKGNGEPGKWSFELTGNRACLKDDVWVMERGRSLNDFFNV